MLDVLIVLFFLLSSLDLVLTIRVLNAGGTERNPVFRWLFDHTHPIVGYAAKVGLTLAVIIVTDTFFPAAGYILYPLGIGLFGYAAYHNAKQIGIGWL